MCLCGTVVSFLSLTQKTLLILHFLSLICWIQWKHLGKTQLISTDYVSGSISVPAQIFGSLMGGYLLKRFQIGCKGWFDSKNQDYALRLNSYQYQWLIWVKSFSVVFSIILHICCQIRQIWQIYLAFLCFGLSFIFLHISWHVSSFNTYY